MSRVFRHESSAGQNGGLWSFSYIDWQGKVQTGVGTESRQETVELAERVQAEHHFLRKHRIKSRMNGSEPASESSTHTLPASTARPSVGPPPRSKDAGESLADPYDGAGDVDDAPSAMRLGERMAQEGLITGEQLQWALEYQEANGGRLVEILIEHQLVTPDTYVRFMGRQPNTPFIDLENCDIPMDVIELLPIHIVKELEVMPIDRMGKMLSVAMICPIDKNALASLHRHTGLQVRPMLCSHAGFRKALKRHYR